MSAEAAMSADTIAAVLSEIAGRPDDRIAVDDGVRQLTYRSLAAEAAMLALRIEAKIPPGLPIGLILPVNADYVIAIVAIMISGHPYVALDPTFPPLQHARIAEYAGLAAVIVDEPGAAIMASTIPSLLQIPLGEQSDAHAPVPEIKLVTVSATPAFIYYTSGSTGLPKGVIYEQGNLIHEIRTYIAALSIGPTDRISMLYRPSASAGSRDIFTALVAGARLCIVDLKRWGTNETRRRLAAHGITIYHSSPPVFRAVMGGDAASTEDFSALRVVHLIGDRIVPADLMLVQQRFGADCRLYIDVATTETFSYASWLVDPEIAVENDLVAVGWPRGESRLRVVDDEGRPVAPGGQGEIVVTTSTAARGYWRDEATTCSRFRPSTAIPGAIDYQTGDIGCFRANGLLDFIGRKDRQVKIAGNTVHPGAVEATISAMPDIDTVAIVARPLGAEVSLVAYWIGNASEAAIRDWCAERLPPFMCPGEFIAVDDLPTLGTGKIDYATLKEHDRKRVDAAKLIPPPVTMDRPALMGVVRASWEKFLPDTFDQDRSFEESGGDSLMALNLFARLEERLGRSLPLSLLTRSVTPSDLIVGLKALFEPGPQGPAVVKPVMFFFPGLFAEGAEIATSELSQRLAARFQVRMVDYRNGSVLHGQFRPKALFDELVREMSEAATAGSIWVMGYSYGTKVAAEALRLGEPAGIRIERFINLDGAIGVVRAPVVHHRNLSARLRNGAAVHRGLLRYFVSGFAFNATGWLVRRRYLLAVRIGLSALEMMGCASVYRRCRQQCVGFLRHEAFGDIPRGRIAFPMTMLTATATASRSPDLGWRRFCDDLEIREIGGRHQRFIADQMDALVNAILSLQ